MELQTVTGDSYVLSLARFIRSHEAALSGSIASSTAGPSWLPSLTSSKAAAAGPSRVIPPKPLSISLHHLSYVLLRFEALGLPIGRLDEPLPKSLKDRRPQSTFSYISASEQRSLTRRGNGAGALNPETMSLSSVRSALTRMSIGAASTASWFGGSGASAHRPPDPDREVKYLYSAFTKLPAVNVIQAEPSGLIEGFEDAASPTTLTPFDVFKNLHLLSFTDVDPRTITGWMKLSCHLRSLTLIRTGIEDVEELVVGHVLEESNSRRKAESATGNGSAASSHLSSPSIHTEDPSSLASNNSISALPSLSWHFLSSLCLPSSSLTFFPSLPLPSLRSLDLSHNLLNSVPPSLANSPLLVSLDLAGNLIEDCRGAREALPAIRTLNLRGNRLEALSGLDSLITLKQVDLRDNSIYEASEVGRLAQLPTLEKIWIKDNPLSEEYADPRVEVLIEFAKEGWPMEGRGTITIDGEAPGYWEKGRVSERLPLGMKLAAPGSTRRSRRMSASEGHSISSGSRGSRETTPRAEESVVPWAANATHEDGAQVMSVKHKGQHGTASSQKSLAAGESARVGGRKARLPELDETLPTSHSREGSRDATQPTSRNNGRLVAEKKRHRRVVDLDDETGSGKMNKAPVELSEAEKLKREVLFGTHDRNVASGKPSSALRTGGQTAAEVSSSSRTPTSSRPVSPLGPANQHEQIGQSKHNDQKLTESVAIASKGRQAAAGNSGAKKQPEAKVISGGQARSRPAKAAVVDEETDRQKRGSQVQTAAELRARIEGLKREVGEDWMRVLSRGEG